MPNAPHLLSSLLFSAVCLIALRAFGNPVNASDPLPGVWQQVDDVSGRVQAHVRITKAENGLYQGVVEKLIPAPGDPPNPKCEDCRDQRRNQPVLGMQIIEGLKRVEDGVYKGGQILDPDNGETYRLKIVVLEKGAKLDVRGYIGIALFGRSQIWLRATGDK